MAWLVIATWGFSFEGVKAAGELLGRNANAFDAVERVGNMVEDDPEVDTVGYGGIPNIDGEVELDGAFMDGKTLAIGGVAAMKGYRNPISVARHVMTDLPHNLLVGQGAEQFADHCGYTKSILLTDKSIETWNEKKRAIVQAKSAVHGHDTVGIVALDTMGRMACGTSTSGVYLKHGGRVGDSPLVGSGFYVDGEAGGAAATGVGEDIMKCCTSFTIVELIRSGCHPQKAAEEAVKRAHLRLALENDTVGNIAVICADRNGNYGGAANHEGFDFAVATDKVKPVVCRAKPIIVT